MQAFRPYSSFFAAKTDVVPSRMINAMKRKNLQNPEQEIEHEEDNDVLTELSLSCKFQRKFKKPRTSEASSSKNSPIEKESLLSLANAIAASNVITDCEREVFYGKKNHSQEKVSTELTLFNESWIAKNRNFMEDSADNFSTSILRSKKPLSRDALGVELKQKTVACKIAAMRVYNSREEQDERRMGVSTEEVKLCEDPFNIKKKLTISDLGNLCRLLLRSSSVKNHVLPFLSIDRANEIESDKGAQVMIWDQDTRSGHPLIFKKWSSSKSYVFIDKWNQDFVHRRDLKEGDEIGLYWDTYYSRFNFCVLKRAPRN